MRFGLFVRFCNEGEGLETELPPVGPIDHLVLRQRRIVGERGHANDAEDLTVLTDRRTEAELELRWAMRGGRARPRRAEIRVTADDGVLLRFATFGDKRERNRIPELGPFAVVVIGRQGIWADGHPIAARVREPTTGWRLLRAVGAEYVGSLKPDVAFRTPTTRYHSSIAEVGGVIQTPVLAPKREPERSATPATLPVAASPPVSRMPSSAGTLLDRIGTPSSASAGGPVAADRAEARGWLETARRLRFVVIGAVVLALFGYGIRTLTDPAAGAAQVRTVGFGQTVSGPRWDYQVTAVAHVSVVGAQRAHGVFLVVRLGLTNHGGTQPYPSDFSLVDSTGSEYSAMSLSSGVYQTPDSLDAPFIWGPSFPPGRSVIVPLIFDIDPSRHGLQLVIPEARAHVRLD